LNGRGGRHSTCWATASRRGHERYQRVPDGFLDRVGRCAVERHHVDDGLDDDASPHELPDDIAHIVVVAPEAINPANHEHVAGPQLVEVLMPDTPLSATTSSIEKPAASA